MLYITDLANSDSRFSDGYPSRFRSSVNPDWNPQLDPVKWSKSSRNRTPPYSIIIGININIIIIIQQTDN